MGDPMTRAYLSLLGGFDFGGEAAEVSGLTRKARAIVAYLALQSGHSQSREKLATLLWGSCGEAQARMNLRQALSAVRRAMPSSKGDWVLSNGGRIILDLADVVFDVVRFEALAAGSSPGELEQAITLYRGDLLDGFGLKEEPFEDWLRVERERLRTVAVEVLEKLVSHYFAAKRLGSCVEAATRLLASDPLREDIHRTLMQAYAAQGRFNLALKQYELCRDALNQQLRLQPAPQTRALYEELRGRRMGSHPHARTNCGGVPPPGISPLSQSQAAEQVSFETQPVRPPTHYVKSAGINIAYQVTGDGPLDMVYVPGWVSNLDYAWESPRLTHVLQRLGSFCRLIRIDKRGTGLSDRNVGFPTLEERMEDVRAVLDEVGSRRTVLFGSSEGAIMCMLFAASYPQRTRALILHGAYAKGLKSEDYPWGRTRRELEEDLAAIERDWGEPADLRRAAPSLVNDTHEREWFAAYLRNSASPADAISMWRWGTEMDARGILDAIHVPTLIIQRIGDQWVSVDEARYLAKHIPGATYLELPGNDHLIWGADSDRLVDAIHEFVVGAEPPVAIETVLLTVMHIEITGASAKAKSNDLAFDDLAFQALAQLHHNEIAHEIHRTDGQQIARTGHGFIAVFQRPTRAIECAMELRDRMKQLDLVVRAAVHIGECEKRGSELEGAALHLASKLAGQAKPGDIVASRTVRDLVVGSNLTFDLCGEVELADTLGPWQFYSIGKSFPPHRLAESASTI
jgi:DNA-binding SARP family transcriptional activator/pimeloyl-ACP methyl ester carboxylesterase/class 3 adenylate cyclase